VNRLKERGETLGGFCSTNPSSMEGGKKYKPDEMHQTDGKKVSLKKRKTHDQKNCCAVIGKRIFVVAVHKQQKKLHAKVPWWKKRGFSYPGSCRGGL